MAKLHPTLEPSTNQYLIIAWGVLAGLFASVSRPQSLLIVALATVLGAVGGYMQCLALMDAKDRFIHASTAMEIRRILISTKWGRRYIYLLWSWLFILIACSLWLGGWKAPLLFLTGKFSQMFIREIVTLKTTKALSRLVRQESFVAH